MALAMIRLGRGAWRYDPDRPLGPPGGFGQVFEGQGDRSERLAIKRLHLSADSLAHREMRVAEQLLDRNLEWVVPILDAGKDQDSDFYFVVMERAERSLQEELDARGAFPQAEALEVFLSICFGLREVKDLVHRDLKPGNILLQRGRWKLSDFGIARFVEESTSARTLRDFLSAPYAAPEQWQGERATPATDVYALGCIAHALIAGRPPYLGPAREDFRHQHLNEVAPPLEQAGLRLRGLVATMLRKQPATRPSVERVRTQLESQERTAGEGPGSGVLARAGAAVAEEEARVEAEIGSTLRAQGARVELGEAARVNLTELFRQLWLRVKEQALAAREISAHEIVLGKGSLSWRFTHEIIPPGTFGHSGWDVVVGAEIKVTQEYTEGVSGRSASLWYVRRPGEADYRWIEIPYMANPLVKTFFGSSVEPFSLSDVGVHNPEVADLAASTNTSEFQFAAQPVAIDDEDFESFCDRWMERLGLAAETMLTKLSKLPE